jgi:hypothetical protein
VIQRGDGARFALESLLDFRRGRKMRGENFDRDRAVESRVFRFVNFAYAARAQR